MTSTTPPPSNLPVINNDAERIHLRNELASFRVAFYSDAAQTMPVTPIDATEYPAYTIFDINNNVVQSGIGVADSTPGTFKVDFLVPQDAPLSQDLTRWRIEWVLVSTDNRQYNFTEEFDVKDVVITASETREQKFIAMVNQDHRVFLRLGNRPVEVFLDVYQGTSSVKLEADVALGAGITEAIDGDSLVYYHDIPASVIGVLPCPFSVIWKVRETITEPFQFHYQVVTAVNAHILNDITALRMLIDKFQKRLGTVQAYEDSDIVEYLERGNELVNSAHPLTSFGFGFTPNPLKVFHILFSAWYGLNAQHLLHSDLAVSFSGQTISFDYDQTGALSDTMGRWADFISNNLPAAKLGLVRRSSPVGTVAGRAYRYTDINLFTYKIASLPGGTNSILSTLTRLGLLF